MLQAELKSMQLGEPFVHERHPVGEGRVLTVGIGVQGEAWADQFTFWVCTPQWVVEELLPGDSRFGKGLLIVAAMQPRLIQQALEKLCAGTRGPTWLAIATQLAHYAEWDYEGYTEDRTLPT